MKRSIFAQLTSVVLALVMVFTLAGCQQTQGKLDPKNPVSIEIWHYYNGPQKIAFDELVSDFNDTVGLEQGIIVEAFSQGDVNELITKVLDAANKKVGAGDIPDIFAAYADTAYQVDQLGLAANLEDYLTEEEISAYIPEYIEEGRLGSDGGLKIFPTAKSTEILMLNQTDWDQFASETGASLDSLQTMEGITAVAKQYYEWTDAKTDTPNDGKAFFGRDAMANYFLIGAKQLGFDLFDVENGKVTFQTDETAMRRLWDNYYLPYISGYFGAYGRFRSDDAKTGDIIALVGSTSGAAYFPDQVMINDTESYPIETQVFAAPCFAGGEKVAVQQGAGMVITKSNEQTEYASTVFLKWFTDAQRNIAFSADSGYLPVKTEANDYTLLQKTVQEEQIEISDNLMGSLKVAMEMTKEYTMYTSKAFEGGTNARKVLEYSLSDKAAADRESVVNLMAAGMSLDEAVAQFNTDDNFSQWLTQFQNDLEQSIQ